MTRWSKACTSVLLQLYFTSRSFITQWRQTDTKIENPNCIAVIHAKFIDSIQPHLSGWKRKYNWVVGKYSPLMISRIMIVNGSWGIFKSRPQIARNFGVSGISCYLFTIRYWRQRLEAIISCRRKLRNSHEYAKKNTTLKIEKISGIPFTLHRLCLYTTNTKLNARSWVYAFLNTFDVTRLGRTHVRTCITLTWRQDQKRKRNSETGSLRNTSNS